MWREINPDENEVLDQSAQQIVDDERLTRRTAEEQLCSAEKLPPENSLLNSSSICDIRYGIQAAYLGQRM